MSDFVQTYKPRYMPRAWRREVATEAERAKLLNVARNVGLPQRLGQPDHVLCFFDATGLLRIFVFQFAAHRQTVEIRINRHACWVVTRPWLLRAEDSWQLKMNCILWAIRGDELWTVAARPVPYFIQTKSDGQVHYRRCRT